MHDVDFTPGAMGQPSTWFKTSQGVWATCPKGHSAMLDHMVRSDGKVTPSLVCPDADCGFHEHIRLIGWEP